ncbi:MAG: DUF3307 domain-containing protein [Planctomycetota bacterium]|jgi:hypothetical protein
MELFFLFLVGHALCDFILQSGAMGALKNRRRNLRTDSGPAVPPWYFWLSAHSLTHGGAVYFITGSWHLGAVESILHAAIDHLKCEERLSIHQDQALHIACKVIYVVFLI